MVSTKAHFLRRESVTERSRTDPRSPAIDEAMAWLRGDGDLLTAGMGRSVPVTMQLGVLAHAGIDRLRDLGRYCRRGSVRRSWGTDMATLAGDLARRCQSPEELRRLQAEILVPLEIEVLAGRRRIADRQELISCLRDLILS